MDIAAALLSAISGLAGVALGGWLTFKNTSKDKLRDLRRETYGSILYDFSEIAKVLDVADEYISQGGWDRYFSSDAEKKHNEQISNHTIAISKRISENYLIISDEFRRIYDSYLREIQQSDNDAFYEENHAFDDAVRKYRPLLLAQARKETFG